MTVLQKLLADFDGPAWATFGVALAAFAVSACALWRSRTPQPHWELVTTSHETGDPDLYDPYSDQMLRSVPKWTAVIRQTGPGTAESVFTSRRAPDGRWSEDQRYPHLLVGRGAEAGIILCSGSKVAGVYRIRIKYRTLPNTRRERIWEETVSLT